MKWDGKYWSQVYFRYLDCQAVCLISFLYFLPTAGWWWVVCELSASCAENTHTIVVTCSCGWGICWQQAICFTAEIILGSLDPGRCYHNFKSIISETCYGFKFMDISCKIALTQVMPQNNLSDKPALVQVMTWCYQATSHYLSQCWPSIMSPCNATRPQWINGTSIRNPFSRENRKTFIKYVNTMVTDEWWTQGAMASAAVVLT